MNLKSYLGISVLALSCYTASAQGACTGEAQYRLTCTVQNLFNRSKIELCIQKLCDQEMLRQGFAMPGEMIKFMNEIRKQLRLQPPPQPAVTTPPIIQAAYDAYKKQPNLDNWQKLVAHVPQADEDAAMVFVDPITFTFMQDPYRLKGTNFVFEHDTIMEWAANRQSKNLPVTNPLTNEPMDVTQLESDLDLKKTIETYVFEKLGITHLAEAKP